MWVCFLMSIPFCVVNDFNEDCIIFKTIENKVPTRGNLKKWAIPAYLRKKRLRGKCPTKIFCSDKAIVNTLVIFNDIQLTLVWVRRASHLPQKHEINEHNAYYFFVWKTTKTSMLSRVSTDKLLNQRKFFDFWINNWLKVKI